MFSVQATFEVQFTCRMHAKQQSFLTLTVPEGQVTGSQTALLQFGLGKHEGQQSPTAVDSTLLSLQMTAGHSIPSQG